MEVSGQFHAPAALHQYSLDRRLGGPQSRSERGDEEKNSQPLPGLEPPIIQPVAQHYSTELTRFLKLKYVCLTSMGLLAQSWIVFLNS
jgi:hypothetical protein